MTLKQIEILKRSLRKEFDNKLTSEDEEVEIIKLCQYFGFKSLAEEMQEDIRKKVLTNK